MTRLRKQLSIPQYHRISHEGFKFPPVTPKPKRTPGWKLGSGFEGIVLESANGSRVVKTSSASVRRPKQVRSKTRPQKALKVSTALPPILHAEKLENPLKNSSLSNPGTRVRESRRAESISDPSEAQLSDPAISNQVRDLTTTKAKSVKPRTSKRSGRRHLHKSQTIRSDRGSIPDNDVACYQDLQAVRAPSKSERNGWLKRRRDLSFAADGGQEIQDSVQDTCRQDPDDGPSQIINSHNGPWHGEHRPQPGHGDGTQNVRVLTSRFQIETPSRLMEVQDSQEVKKRTSSRAQRETALFPEDTGSDRGLASNQRRYSRGSDRGEPKSLDLGLHRPYEITTTNLNASKYFSNAIKQLSSPNSMPAPVSRSKSTRQAVTLSTPEKGWSEGLPVAFSTQQGSHHISVLPMKSLKRQRTEQGALDLGMTPRLKKSMSNLPFRPPFKALV